MTSKEETCIICGKSVALDSNPPRFADRVYAPADSDDDCERLYGAKYPQGRYICAYCFNGWEEVDIA